MTGCVTLIACPCCVRLPAGNQSSGVLLGMQVPAEQEADFQAAGRKLEPGARIARCLQAPRRQ